MHLAQLRTGTPPSVARPYVARPGAAAWGTCGHPAAGEGFRLLAARTPHEHRAAAALVRRMYAWRGYHVDHAAPSDDPDRITLIAWQQDDAVATLTLGRDAPAGLLCEALYASEIAQLRQAGQILCEVTRLAVDTDYSSRHLLSALFRVAHQHAREHLGATDAVIEVNPRHASFYQREFRFSRLGKLRHCPRVGAPAVLLHRNINALSLPVMQHDRTGRQHLDTSVFPAVVGG